MWAQIIKAQLKPGMEAELPVLMDQLKAAEQPGSGLVHEYAMLDQKDSSIAYVVMFCEDEEKARAREADPVRSELMGPARETMGKMFAAPPEFVDLEVVAQFTG